MLHDPHKKTEPILVISGLAYLFPFYMAINKQKYYDAVIFLFLTFTTVGFHSTRNEYFYALDCCAIVIFFMRTFYLSLNTSSQCKYIYFMSIFYCFVSYFIGKQYSLMSFHPDWNTQMFYHSMMHVFTSYSSYVIMRENPR
jgi:uncharacterized protein with ParB-like and HNH nuclease domain